MSSAVINDVVHNSEGNKIASKLHIVYDAVHITLNSLAISRLQLKSANEGVIRANESNGEEDGSNQVTCLKSFKGLSDKLVGSIEDKTNDPTKEINGLKQLNLLNSELGRVETTYGKSLGRMTTTYGVTSLEKQAGVNSCVVNSLLE